MGEMIPIARLWKRQSQKTGKPYLSGYLGDATLLVFQNEKKENDKDPDYTAFIVAREQRGQGGNGQNGGQR